MYTCHRLHHKKRKFIAKTHWEDKASKFVSPEFVRRSKFEKLFINIYFVSNIKNLIRNIKHSFECINRWYYYLIDWNTIIMLDMRSFWVLWYKYLNKKSITLKDGERKLKNDSSEEISEVRVQCRSLKLGERKYQRCDANSGGHNLH